MSDRIAELIGVLNQRILLMGENGENPQAILDPVGVRHAAELAQLIQDPGRFQAHLYAAATLAGWHWFRYLALPTGPDEAEAQIAMRWATTVAEVNPDLMPPEIMHRLRQTTQPLGRLFNQATRLYERFDESGDLADIRQAISLFERVVEQTPTEDGDRAERLNSLGNALQARYERTGVDADINAAITAGRAAVASCGDNDPDRAMYLHNLAYAYYLRFQTRPTSADLDEATTHARAALQATPARHPQRALPLSHLALICQSRYQHYTSPSDLDEAISLGSQAVSATRGTHPMYLHNLGSIYRDRGIFTRSVDDCAEARRLANAAIEATPRGHRDRPLRLFALGMTHRAIFDLTGEIQELNRAIDYKRQALEAIPAQHRQRASYLADLAYDLRIRFEHSSVSQDPQDLEAAIAAGAKAVTLTTPGQRVHSSSLNGLALAYKHKFEYANSPDDLDAFLRYAHQAVDTAPAEDDFRPSYLCNLGMAYLLRGQRDDNPADLNTAVTIGTDAVIVTDDDHKERAVRLNGLALAYQARGTLRRSAEDLGEAIRLGRLAADLTDSKDPNYPKWLSNLHNAYRARLALTESLTDLDEAMGILREGVAALPAGHPLRESFETILASSRESRPLLAYAAQHGWSEEETIVRNALEALPDSHPIPSGLVALSQAIDQAWAADASGVSALDDAIDRLERVLTDSGLTPDQEPLILPIVQSSLGNAYRSRYVRAGRHVGEGRHLGKGKDRGYEAASADLERAYELCAAAVTEYPQHPGRSDFLTNLGVVHRTRFEHSGDNAELDAAVDRVTQAYKATSPENPNWVTITSTLANIHHSRSLAFRARSATDDDLDKAIEYGTKVEERVTQSPEDHPDSARHLANLCAARLERSQRGQIRQDPEDNLTPAIRNNPEDPDLVEAIRLGEQAVASTPERNAHRGTRTANLAQAYAERAKRLLRAKTPPAVEPGADAVEPEPDAADAVSRAVHYAREALRATPESLPAYPRLQQTLANIYVLRAIVHQKPEYAQEALSLWRAAVDSTPDGHPAQAHRLSNLAIGYWSAGPDMVDPSTPALARQTPLSMLMSRIRHGRDTTNTRTAYHLWRKAVSVPAAAVSDRVRAARAWGEAAADDYLLDRPSRHTAREARDAFSEAVRLLPRLAWRGLDPRLRRQHLVDVSGIASEAAAWALVNGDEEQAVEMLEHGRSVLWEQQLQLTTPLTRLQSAHPTLYEKLEDLRRKLDPTAQPRPCVEDTAEAVPARDEVDPHQTAHMYREYVRQWDELVEEVRQLGGDFTDFLKPPRFKQLANVADGATVVIINVARPRCDALIIRGGKVTVLPLPDLSLREARRRSATYLQALTDVDKAYEVYKQLHQGDGSPTAIRKSQKAAWQLEGKEQHLTQTLTNLLAWLWDTVAGPVLAHLGYTAAIPPESSVPRVWWCPTGPLALLPLHAAGYHAPHATGQAVIDRVVSSYTPTVKALLEAQRPRRWQSERFLVITVPGEPGQASLPVTRERETLETLFPGERHTCLTGSEVTAARVVEEISQHRWVHVGCHGSQDVEDPSRGKLSLYQNEELTIMDLARGRYSGEFAALAACQTHTGGRDLPDESITLASALHYTGFRHVIGTLWSVPDGDEETADVFERMYTDLVSDGQFQVGRSASALRRAVMNLRAQSRDHPIVWVPFVHIGP